MPGRLFLGGQMSRNQHIGNQNIGQSGNQQTGTKPKLCTACILRTSLIISYLELSV